VIRRRLDLQDQHQAVLVLPPVCKSTEAAGAVWAAMIVQKVHADVRVLLPGAGAEVSRILRLCEAVGQRFMVRSVGSAVGLDELLVAADLALLNAPGDVPVDALVRAMGALAPIVARKSALISSLLVDGESGWLFDSGRPHAIARRLVVALEAPQERAQLAKAAQKKAERLSDGSANVDRYAAMVRGLCASA
jgi:glycosyltransferase involved in cell wall biosynthesis